MTDIAAFATAAAVADARADGCDCNPDTDATEVMPGWWMVNVMHDDWCRLWRASRASSN